MATTTIITNTNPLSATTTPTGVKVPILGYAYVEDQCLPIVLKPPCRDDGLINASYGSKPSPHVQLSRAALALPDHVRLAVIGHELGHHHYGHCPGIRTLEIELEADAYAIEVAGLAAVHQLLKTARKMLEHRGLDSSEVIDRLRALPSCPKMAKVKARIPSRRKRRRRK
jgi:hypothetical protein